MIGFLLGLCLGVIITKKVRLKRSYRFKLFGYVVHITKPATVPVTDKTKKDPPAEASRSILGVKV